MYAAVSLETIFIDQQSFFVDKAQVILRNNEKTIFIVSLT